MQQERLITMSESKKYEIICRVLKKEITQVSYLLLCDFHKNLIKN